MNQRFSRQFVEHNIRQYGEWFGDEYLPEGMTQAECRAMAEQFHGPAAQAMAISAKPPAALSRSAGSAGETLDRPSAATLARCERLGLRVGGSVSSMALSQSAGQELIGGIKDAHDEARVPTDSEIKNQANLWAAALSNQRDAEWALRGKTTADPDYAKLRQAAEDATKKSGELEAQLRQVVSRADAKK